MKSLMIILVLASTTAMASGKFIFMPKKNFTKDVNLVEMGFSVYQPILAKKLFLNHYTSLSTVDNKRYYQMSDFSFKNGLVLQPMDLLQFEVGHEYKKNMISKYNENIGFMKVSTQLW